MVRSKFALPLYIWYICIINCKTTNNGNTFEWYETPVPNNETDETEKTTIHARITLNGK